MSIARFFSDLLNPPPAGDPDAAPVTSLATPATPPAGDPAGGDPVAGGVGAEGVPNGDPNGTPAPGDEQPGDEQPPAADVESLARRLHTELVRADGRVSDPADIPFDPAHLDDQAALTAAIDAAIESRPGIRARQYGGDIGAGNRGGSQRPPVDLIQLMRDIQP